MARACARHILVKTREEAEKLKARIAKGEDFGKLAKQYSQCPSKNAAAISGSLALGRWSRRSIKWCSKSRCSKCMARSKPSLVFI